MYLMSGFHCIFWMCVHTCECNNVHIIINSLMWCSVWGISLNKNNWKYARHLFRTFSNTKESFKWISMRQNPLHLQCMIHVHVACYTVQTALIQCIWVIPSITCVLYQNIKLVNTLKITIQPVKHPLLYSETSKLMFK